MKDNDKILGLLSDDELNSIDSNVIQQVEITDATSPASGAAAGGAAGAGFGAALI